MGKQLELQFSGGEPLGTTATLQVRGLERIERFDGEYLIGIDEVGIGCWAGPVTVAAVVASKKWRDVRVKDSKVLTPARREEVLEAAVLPSIVFSRVFSMSSAYIDEFGVGKALRDLTESVGCLCRIAYPNALVVQDGDQPVMIDGSMRGIVCFPKADALVTVVSAASILAKVTRDRIMRQEALRWPQYKFHQNMGYHSADHVAALKQYGVTPIHRRSYKPVQAIIRGDV